MNRPCYQQSIGTTVSLKIFHPCGHMIARRWRDFDQSILYMTSPSYLPAQKLMLLSLWSTAFGKRKPAGVGGGGLKRESMGARLTGQLARS